VLHRPDTYIGSVQRSARKVWLVDEAGGSIRFADVEISAGFLKIFDEILVNAMDRQYEDEALKSIAVLADASSGQISVRNSGSGIPVRVHAQHGVYIPSLIFGEFLSGENFDDSRVRFVGGRNGIGAKATNVFSAEFELDVVDPASQQRFRQTWSANMARASQPLVGKVAASAKGYVQVRYLPDYARFEMPAGLDADTLAVLRSRVSDAAACTKPPREALVQRRAARGRKVCRLREPAARRGQGGAAVRVRAAARRRRHDRPRRAHRRALAVGLPVRRLCERDPLLGRHARRRALCRARAPDARAAGVGQAQEAAAQAVHGAQPAPPRRQAPRQQPDLRLAEQGQALTSPQRDWGFKLALSSKFVKDLERTGVGDAVLAFCEHKEKAGLSKDSAVKRGACVLVEKLDDALNAGKAGSDCTLLLTEGDSAKALAVAGVSVVGRANYGIYPLRGKPLNTRKVSLKKLSENVELGHLMRIVGLEYAKAYTSLSSPRYKSITIFSDQDLDGHHIAGLIVNLIHSQWPSLLELKPDFIRRFATPLVKVTQAGGAELGFFTQQEFAEWQAGRAAGGYKVRYLKGLGSSNNLDAKKYFSHVRGCIARPARARGGEARGAEAPSLTFSRARAHTRSSTSTWSRSRARAPSATRPS
jgi:DNA topoisomerase-2